MFGMAQMIKIIAALLICVIVTFGLVYISNLKADLAVSQINEEVLKSSVEDQQNLIISIKRDVAEIQSINKKLNEAAQGHAQEVRDLTDKFNKSSSGKDRDFGVLAAANSRLIERLVNRGSKAVSRCIAIATGAPLTEKEINATKASEINRECTAIANPNYIPVTP